MLYYVLLGVIVVDCYARFRAPERRVLGRPKGPCDSGVTGCPYSGSEVSLAGDPSDNGAGKPGRLAGTSALIRVSDSRRIASSGALLRRRRAPRLVAVRRLMGIKRRQLRGQSARFPGPAENPRCWTLRTQGGRSWDVGQESWGSRQQLGQLPL